MELSDILLRLQDDFEWPMRADYYEPVTSWARERSGSRFHHLRGHPDGPEVVVKTVDAWSSRQAHQMFDTMGGLVELVTRSRIEGISAMPPLAWVADPAGLVTPYVEGEDLVSILRDPQHPAWPERLEQWIGSAGAILAAYHAAHPHPETATEQREEAGILADRLRIHRDFRDVDWPARVSSSYGDFGPGNLHASPDGIAYLLDPPLSPTPAPVHKDLANFLFEMRRQLAGRGFTPSPPLPGRFERLRDAFLGGYSSQAGVDLDGADRSLVALYEARRALGMTRKRMPRRPWDAIWFFRLANSRRREAGRQE